MVRLLGQGGMGKVYLAQHQRIARHVAVKVLLPELSSNQEVIERFFTEAQATSLIKHPGIVEVTDCDILDEQAFIVMEYLRGESLAGYWARLGGRMDDMPFALAVIAQVADAVGAAHGAGIIHRDLKPDNVFLCAGPRGSAVTPKVLDFGIAKIATQGSISNTRTGLVIGTPTYMSPEQCRESKTVDGRADVYSLGCIFFEALCGRPPFVRESLADMIIAHVSEMPDDPRTLVPDLPPGIVQLLGRMLAKSKEERPTTMAMVATEIRQALNAMGVNTPVADVLPRRAVVRPHVEIDARLRTPIPPSLKGTPPTDPGARTPSLPGGSSPGLDSGARQAPPVGSNASVPGAPMSTRSTLGSAAGERAAAEDDLKPPTSSRRWVIPAALVAVGGLALAGKLVLSRSDDATVKPQAAEIEKPGTVATTAAPAVTAPPTPPPAPDPPAAPPMVTVEVRGIAPGAEVWLDGARAPELPLKIKRDDQRHRLVVRASGYEERALEIAADRDRTIDLPMTASPKAAKHRAPTATAARGAAPSTSAAAPAAARTAATPAAAVTPPPRNTDTTTPAKKVPDNHGRRSNYDDM